MEFPSSLIVRASGGDAKRGVKPASTTTILTKPDGRLVMNRMGRFALVAITMVAILERLASGAGSLIPLSYAGVLPDGTGGNRVVAFQGQIAGAALAGELTLDGVRHKLVATLGPDGSVAGVVYRDDLIVATFSGQPDGVRGLRGDFMLNGQGGNWELPVVLPSALSTTTP